MGEVWLGEHLTISRKVAIKLLHPQYARNEKIRQRFRNEAATLSKLKHPNIITLYDFIESDSDFYLVMEYVEGRNLEEVVRFETGPMPTNILEKVFGQILAAVGYAHSQGVIHRDIKPSNFMMDSAGNVKVLDFGIAKLLEDDQHLTRTGMRMGTTFYMSPEQVNTEAIDHRSDVYSLGVTLFFLATGKAPYEGETSEYKIFDQIIRKPLPLARSIYVGVSPTIDKMIQKATAKVPRDRYAGCEEFQLGFLGKAQETLPRKDKPSINSASKGDGGLIRRWAAKLDIGYRDFFVLILLSGGLLLIIPIIFATFNYHYNHFATKLASKFRAVNRDIFTLIVITAISLLIYVCLLIFRKY